MLVHVEPYSYPTLLAVGNDTRQVQFVDHLGGIAVVAGTGHIPLPVKQHIGYPMLGTEVDDLEPRLGGYVCPHDLAGAHPLGRIGHLAGGVEVEDDVVMLDEPSRRIGHHHHLPWSGTVGDHIDGTVHHAAQRIRIGGRHLKLGEAPVVHVGIGEGHPESIGEVERQCPLHGLGELGQGSMREGRLCPALGPGTCACGEAILGEVVHHLMEDGLLVLGQEVAESDALIVGTHLHVEAVV